MPPSDSSRLNPIGGLLTSSLALRSADTLLVVYDETSAQFFGDLLGIAQDLEIRVLSVFVDQKEQSRGPDRSLSQYQELVPGVSSYIMCLGQSFRTFRARHLFRSSTHPAVRTATMPGFNHLHYDTLIADHDSLTMSCESLLPPLWKGQDLDIVTCDGAGLYHLHLRLLAYERIPMASTGRIARGQTGNIPGGEVFVTPLEGSAEGVIAINAGVPGLVIPPGESVRLRFSSGRLVGRDGWVPALQYFRELEAFERLHMSEWSRIGEFGLGLNSRISELTGVSVIDEKALGTAHLGLGFNANIGGDIATGPHTDLIFRPHTIAVDERLIFADGSPTEPDMIWLEDADTWSRDPNTIVPADVLYQAAVSNWQSEDGCYLFRCVWDARGRHSRIRVGADGCVHELLAILTAMGDRRLDFDSILSSTGISPSRLAVLLDILCCTGIAEVSP